MKNNRVQHDFVIQLLSALEQAGVSPDQLFSMSRLQGMPATGPGDTSGRIQDASASAGISRLNIRYM
jgi:hypothetical protein